MNPPAINPAFARFVVKVEPPLSASLAKNKKRLAYLREGKTTHGTKRKLKSKYGAV